MIRIKLLFSAAFMVAGSALAGLATDGAREVPGHGLAINQEEYFTSKQGVAIPEQIAKATVGKLVKIYRTDGFCYNGKITEIEESSEGFKVYGEVLNVAGTSFGFAMMKGGKFAGAVLDKINDVVYVLEFSDAHKGFVLKRSYKYDKITS